MSIRKPAAAIITSTVQTRMISRVPRQASTLMIATTASVVMNTTVLWSAAK